MSKKDWKYHDKIKRDWREVKKEDVDPKNNDHLRVRISFEYVDPGKEYCLSHCKSEDVKHSADCFRRMTTLTWIQVMQTATKQVSDKTGLHWTSYKDAALAIRRPDNISPDHTISAVRAGGKYRIFGFRLAADFYVLWYDPEHKICPV